MQPTLPLANENPNTSGVFKPYFTSTNAWHCNICDGYSSDVYKPRMVDKRCQVNRPVVMCYRCQHKVNQFLGIMNSSWRMVRQPHDKTQ